MMKRLSSLVLCSCLFLIGCENQFRDEIAQLHKEIDDVKARLEAFCEETNSNIAALQTMITALQAKDYVTSVVPVIENGVEVGYVITFEKSGKVTIYHGQDGKDGVDGADGKDGYTPVIGVKKDADGLYYWTLDGDWLLDADGKMVRAQGLDGQDGQDGKDGEDGEDGKDGADGEDGATGPQGPQGPQGESGKDAVVPQLKIVDGYWYISIDGQTWENIGKATGDKGEQGEQGPQGDKGDKGDKGDSFFQDVDCTSDPSHIIITLTDGTQIKLPTWYAYEALQAQVNKMNSNIGALQEIVIALQNNDYVTGVTPIYENGKEIGYTISFSKGETITVYHGKDGADGKDGNTPQIGIRKDTDGIYYWTLKGDWLLDEDGNKIKAVGVDGATGPQGPQGEPGEDAVAPQLKIVDGYWYISIDGQTWENIGKATGDKGEQGPQGDKGDKGDKGDSFFQDVDASDPDYVILTLTDGTVIQLPKYKEMSIRFYDESSAELDGPIAFQPGAERTITYSAQGSGDLKVAVLASNGWIAIISRTDDKKGSIKITAPAVWVDSEVVVLVSNGEATFMETVAMMPKNMESSSEHEGFESDPNDPSIAW